MNLFVTVPLTLIVILATLFYLAKVKTDNLGSFFKWAGYLVLIAAVGLLVCLMFKGVRKMTRHDRSDGKTGMYMRHSVKGGKGMMGSCSGMDDCSGMNKMNCGPGKGMSDGGCCACCGDMEMMGKGQMGAGRKRMKSESTTDTIDGKIIRKEIEVIEK